MYLFVSKDGELIKSPAIQLSALIALRQHRYIKFSEDSGVVKLTDNGMEMAMEKLRRVEKYEVKA